MRYLLKLVLPVVVPLIARWVSLQEKMILEAGQPLDPSELENARQMGVQCPEKIRILLVDEISGPTSFLLKMAADVLNFYGPGLEGITYRYGILIRRDRYPNLHLIAHECVHTAQYERLGGLGPFLKSYLYECLVIGYPGGPLEQEAINRSAVAG